MADFAELQRAAPAMARYNTASAALRHATNGTTPQKRLCADFETTVAGIPCGVLAPMNQS
jgi:hypothetical protein